jgi:uncharacterized protein
MTQPANAGEPSMEEILASIRRIIADDDTTKLAQPEPEGSRIAAAALNRAPRDARELTEAITAPTSQPAAPIPQFRATDGNCDVGFAVVAEKSAARGKPDETQLLSGETSAAVDAAFNTLAQSVLVSNARTLEDLVREMLRPMLKIWLDENLPRLVERLVRAEIERISPGPRA